MPILSERSDNHYYHRACITSLSSFYKPWALTSYDDLSVLLQYMILRSRLDMGFSGAEIMSYCDDIKNGEAYVPADEITGVLNYLDDAFTEKRAYLKKVHIPVVLYIAQQAKEKGISPEDFGARLDTFFEELPDDGDYMIACRSGSSKRASVQSRVNIMNEILEDDYDFVPRTAVKPDEPKQKSEGNEPASENA